MSRNISAVAEKLRAKLIPDVVQAMKEGRCSCTTDMWSDKFNNVAYIAVTASYVSADWQLKNLLLILNDFPLDVSHTGDNILEEVQIGLSGIGVMPEELEKVRWTTDEAANCLKAFGSYNHFSCMCHVLCTVLRHTFEEEFFKKDAPQFEKCVRANKKAVKYLKKSGKADSLEAAVHPFFAPRFNSLFKNLRSTFDQYVGVIRRLTFSGKQDIARHLNYTIMETLIEFLDKFRIHIERLQNKSQPTSCLVVPCYLDLKQHCSPRREDSEEMAAIRARALQYLEEKVVLHEEHYLATFLVPSLRHLNGLSQEKKTEVHQLARDMCARIQLTEELENSSDEPRPSTSKLYSFQGWDQTETDIDEVQMYLLMGRPDGEDNILAWWRTRETTYPRLAKVAKELFAIQASSAESERVISRAGVILTDKRNSIGPKKVGDLVFYAINSSQTEDIDLLPLEDEDEQMEEE